MALGWLLAAKDEARDCLSGPQEAIDVWRWGGCWLQDEACQVSVLRVLRFFYGFKRLKDFKGLRAGKR